MGGPVQGGAVDGAGQGRRGKMDGAGPFVVIWPTGVDSWTLEAQASGVNREKAGPCVQSPRPSCGVPLRQREGARGALPRENRDPFVTRPAICFSSKWVSRDLIHTSYNLPI